MPAAKLGFEDAIPTRVVFGPGSVEQVGKLARELAVRKILLVTDAGLVAAGHAGRVQNIFETARFDVAVFDRAIENPTTHTIEECVETARATAPDCIVGLGGGSSLDTAKGCNFILTNGGRIADYRGYGKASKPMLPLIAIPTTAGTGSECQTYALIADDKSHEKMACGDPKAAARIAILDPELTLTLPRAVTAATSIDAIAHAVETAVTKKRTELSWRYSCEAFTLLNANFATVLRDPKNLGARAAMQLGAAYAGVAIERSMLGAAHSAANPLTAHYEIIHGRAVGMMLPHVVRFNGADAGARAIYDDLARFGGLAGFSALVQRLEELLAAAEIPSRLSAYDVPRSVIPMLAEEATRQWTAQFNSRPATTHDFEALYSAAL